MRNLEAELEGKDIKHPSEVNVSATAPDGEEEVEREPALHDRRLHRVSTHAAGNQASSA